MSKRWTEKDLQRLATKGVRIKGIAPEKAKKKKKAKPTAPQLLEMKQWLTIMGIPFTSELVFSKKRKFRFDIALEEHKIAFEYEGVYSKISRHTTMKGYAGDIDKYNLAQIEGWRVFRYTALNYKNFLSDLKTLLNL